MINDFSFDLPKNKSNVIKVIGVGGGGSNAINHMFQQGINGVDFVVTNTDAQALNESAVPTKIQLGASLTEGLGAGANPEVGALAAEESFEDLKTLLNTQTKMVFITAGMGGGTGTGAAPFIAQMAKEMDILTVGIVTMPFQFEGKLRLEQAEKGLENIKKTVDALIVINNNKLREVYGNLGFKAGFSKADEVLSTAARGIAEVITHHYRQNIDLKDAKTVLKDSGTAIMGSGAASGTTRANDAITNALDSPLLNDNKIKGCKNVLLLIVSGNEEITIDEIGEINDFIQTEAGNNANIIMGIGEDQNLGSSVSVTIIATGFGADQQHQIVNTEAKKIIHTLEEDQTLEHDLTGIEKNSDPFEMPQEVESIYAEEHEEIVDINLLDQQGKEPITYSLEVNEEVEIDEEHLFSTPVVAETLGEYADKPQKMEAEDELIATTPAIENIEVVYDVLESALPKLESHQYQDQLEVETEEEFIINDLDEEVLDLEVIESEEVVAEEENQFAFDFDLPISDTQEVSTKKIVHTLSEDEEDEVKEDSSLSEAIDFEFEVVDKVNETPILDVEERLTSPHDDSPFDMKIKETATKKNEERKEYLKKFNHTFNHNVNKIEEFEKQPAYKRMGLELEQPASSDSNESRLSVDNDKNDEIQLRSNNSFLHDNVD